MKILFLDIDGPMIPGRLYFDKKMTYCDHRHLFKYDPIAVQMVNKICDVTGASIVFNTAHNVNADVEGMKGVIAQGIFNGIHPSHIHQKGFTLFPQHSSRQGGINRWLLQNAGVTHYCVIDDEKIPDPNLIHVDFNFGMTMSTYVKAVNLLGRKDGKKESELIF